MTEIDTLDARSISSSAILVDYTLGTPSKKIKAGQKTHEVQQKEETTALTVNKEPYKGTNIDAITSHHTEVRKNVDTIYTLPWTKGGSKLLPMASYEDFIGYITEAKTKHDELVEEFRRDIPLMVERAPDRLKKLFDPRDYPDPDSENSVDAFMSRFKFEYYFEPVPESGDFRVNVGNSAMKELKQGFGKILENRLETGKNSLWARGYDILKEWQDMPNKSTVSKTTVHTKAENLVKLIDKANLTGDTDLKRLRDDLEEIVKSTNIDMLRDKDCRDMEKDLLAEKARNVLSKFDF